MTEIGGGSRLSDIAYTRILETVFERKIPAGAFLSQNDLVEILGIPIAPVRDALKILETEGIVTIHPRSGIQFIKPGLELTRSTYQFPASSNAPPSPSMPTPPTRPSSARSSAGMSPSPASSRTTGSPTGPELKSKSSNSCFTTRSSAASITS